MAVMLCASALGTLLVRRHRLAFLLKLVRHDPLQRLHDGLPVGVAHDRADRLHAHRSEPDTTCRPVGMDVQGVCRAVAEGSRRLGVERLERDLDVFAHDFHAVPLLRQIVQTRHRLLVRRGENCIQVLDEARHFGRVVVERRRREPTQRCDHVVTKPTTRDGRNPLEDVLNDVDPAFREVHEPVRSSAPVVYQSLPPADSCRLQLLGGLGDAESREHCRDVAAADHAVRFALTERVDRDRCALLVRRQDRLETTDRRVRDLALALARVEGDGARLRLVSVTVLLVGAVRPGFLRRGWRYLLLDGVRGGGGRLLLPRGRVAAKACAEGLQDGHGALARVHAKVQNVFDRLHGTCCQSEGGIRSRLAVVDEGVRPLEFCLL